MKKKLVFVYRIITYLIQAAACYLAFCILDAFGALKYLAYDFIPHITVGQFAFLVGFVLLFVFIWSGFNEQINSIYSFLKRNSSVILGFFVVLEIVTYSKAVSNRSLLIVFVGEYLLYWLLLHSLFNKTFTYSFTNNTTMASHFTERPVVGTDNLTTPQKNALECLKGTIDRRDSTDSINIALIGEWGSGKTSITNTLVMELQNRNKPPEYFVLLINTQVIGNTEGIVEYVRSFFAELFRNYGITILNGNNNVAFLTILLDMLKDTRPFSAVKGVIDIGSGNFIDVEQERDVFAKNVRDLLERSGKKNILLVIDNIDRIEGEDQLLLILSEFASINGIISILSLDPKKDSELMGSSTDKSGTEPEELGNYNKLDKYIHARIRIEEIEGIEYDKHVSKQIIEEAKRIRFDPESFIQVDGKYRNSLFQNSSKVEDEKNLLTKLFFINFERSGLSFGKYFENLVMNYFCNSEEISRLNKKANSRDGLPENSQNDRIKNLWSNDSFYQEHEWPDRLQFNIKQILSLFDFFISIIKSINEGRNADQYTLLLQSIFTNKRFDSSVNIEKAAYDQYCDAIAFMYKPEEAELLNNYILRKESDKIESYFNESKNAVTALLYQSFILCDFMKYLRSCMKNYRCFKIQLRECEILDLNYLDYAIKHWKLSNETKTLIDSDTCFKEMDKSNVQSLKSIIKGILFEEYIHNYGGSFELKLSSELKVHLLKKNNNEWVSIEHKTDDETKTYELKVGETKISEEK